MNNWVRGRYKGSCNMSDVLDFNIYAGVKKYEVPQKDVSLTKE